MARKVHRRRTVWFERLLAAAVATGGRPWHRQRRGPGRAAERAGSLSYRCPLHRAGRKAAPAALPGQCRRHPPADPTGAGHAAGHQAAAAACPIPAAGTLGHGHTASRGPGGVPSGQVAAAKHEVTQEGGEQAQNQGIDQGVSHVAGATDVVENDVGRGSQDHQLGVEQHHGRGAEHL